MRVRRSWGLAVIAVLLAGGCGSDPVRPAPVPPSPLPAIGADGRPITNLCQLLSSGDFTAVGVTATSSPDTAAASMTRADCAYGDRIGLSAWVLPDPVAASTVLRTQAGAWASTQDSPVAGVDESVYGVDAQSDAVVVRRRNLVVRITVPAVPDGGKVTLIRLAAVVLSRANALGT